MSSANPWYVAVDDTTVGPALTELVIRGIEHRKIPPEALVCPVGTGSWRPLASVQEFHAAVVRSYPPPPPGSEEARSWLQHGFHFPQPGALPQFDLAAADAGDDDWDSDTAPTTSPRESAPNVDVEVEPETETPAAVAVAAGAWDAVSNADADADLSAEIDAEFSAEVAAEIDAWGAPAVDWSERFQSYFLVGDDVELPEEEALLHSLSVVPRETFRHEEALWNLALCLAFGSDAVGEAAARTFFAAVAEHGSVDRLEWMSRTLMGNGFVPSGIPPEAGRRGCERLRSSCPPPGELFRNRPQATAASPAR